jgi:hypothetical protein
MIIDKNSKNRQKSHIRKWKKAKYTSVTYRILFLDFLTECTHNNCPPCCRYILCHFCSILKFNVTLSNVYKMHVTLQCIVVSALKKTIQSKHNFESGKM